MALKSTKEIGSKGKTETHLIDFGAFSSLWRHDTTINFRKHKLITKNHKKTELTIGASEPKFIPTTTQKSLQLR